MRVHRKTAMWVMMAMGLAVIACNIPGMMPSAPSVEMQTPADGESVALGEAVIVTAVASDTGGAGITEVELFVDGESVKVVESPNGARDVFDVAFTWIPQSEGQTTLTVIAYREDGSPSQAAMITVTVVGVSVERTATIEGVTVTAGVDAPPTDVSIAPTEGAVTIPGRVIREASFRVGPGPACTIIGGIEVNEIITLYAYSADRRWIQTFYAGQLGWVSTAAVAPESDTNLLPITSATGCEGCGDHVCSAAESCTVCSRDCGTCVPPTATPTRTPTRTPSRTPTRTVTPTITATSPATTAAPTTAVATTAVPTAEPTDPPTEPPPTAEP